MVDVREIDGAIAELEKSDLTMQRVQKLASLYIVKNQHEKKEEMKQYEPEMLSAQEELHRGRVSLGGSDFLRVVSDIDIESALMVIDELMAVLKATNPRTYKNIIKKLESLRE